MKSKFYIGLVFILVTFLLASCTSPTSLAPTPTSTKRVSATPPAETQPVLLSTTNALPATFTAAATLAPSQPSTIEAPTQTPLSTVRFGVIGDYGQAGPGESAVAELVKSWNPDFIVTTGDNNYPSGSPDTIDANIGQYFHDYIGDYHGQYGAGSAANRFFPTLGNHDWMWNDAAPYINYFTLPGNERYYDFTWGNLEIFALDSESQEPDGVGSSRQQAQWLQAELAQSTARWKIVVFHEPPYSSGPHGGTDWMRWPFKEWGVSAVLNGHDHDYERLSEDGLPYFVNGLGGGAIYSFNTPVEGSQVRYTGGYGAMLVEGTQESLTFQFITVKGDVIDSYTIK